MPIDMQKCLHEIQNSVNQLRFMEVNCQTLKNAIDELISRTYSNAPLRDRHHHLSQTDRRNPADRERLLEKAIWSQFGNAVRNHDKLADGIDHILTYQMPLQNTRRDTSWGKVDLIGVSPAGTPVVLELKQEDARDTPLRIAVEGVAYAIAVKKAWNEGVLRQDWINNVINPNGLCDPPKLLPTVPVVGIAPTKYWVKRTTSGMEGYVGPNVWNSFFSLCDEFSRRGYPVSFLQFEADESDEDGLPIISNVMGCQLPS